jgi:hypothetical protein
MSSDLLDGRRKGGANPDGRIIRFKRDVAKTELEKKRDILIEESIRVARGVPQETRDWARRVDEFHRQNPNAPGAPQPVDFDK